MEDNVVPPPPTISAASAASSSSSSVTPVEVAMPPPPPPVEELMDQEEELEGPLFSQGESVEHLVAERERLKELTPMTPLTKPLKQKARSLKLAEITRPLSKCVVSLFVYIHQTHKCTSFNFICSSNNFHLLFQ